MFKQKSVLAILKVSLKGRKSRKWTEVQKRKWPIILKDGRV